MKQDVFACAPELSVIIPAYNASKTIVKTLSSLMDQTASNASYEVIVIDDGSTDETLAICAGFAENHPNIHVTHQSNGGVSAARNRGLTQAKGRWVSFVDSDDCVTADYVQSMLTTAPDADYVIFDHTRLADGICTPGNPWLRPWSDRPADMAQVLLWICDNRLNSPWDKRFSLAVIRDNGICFPEGIRIGEDLLFNFAYAHCVSNAYISARRVYCYVDNAVSAMHQKARTDRLREYEAVYDAMMKKCTDGPNRAVTNLSYLRVIARYAGQLHESGHSAKTIACLLDSSAMVQKVLAEPTQSAKNILRKLLLRLRQYGLCARLFRG